MSTSLTPLRWGILGAGAIAGHFCADLKLLADHQAVAIGSRDPRKSKAFGERFGVPHCFANYDDLVTDPDVDIVYVATPHSFHKQHSLQALNAGKPVLCEKPFTINAAEAEAVIAVARTKKLFLMEGMWTRFFPLWHRVRQLIREGAIGRPRMLVADFGFKGGATGSDGKLSGMNPSSRLFDAALGGGALLDVGVYPVSLAHMLFGEPDRVAATATLGHTGVDENTGMLMHYPDGAVAITCASFQVSTSQVATILGTDGKIEVHTPWWRPISMTLSRGGKSPEVIEFPFDGSGYQFEANHVAECLRAGKTESNILSHASSLQVMRTLDSLRAEIGLSYPMEL